MLKLYYISGNRRGRGSRVRAALLFLGLLLAGMSGLAALPPMLPIATRFATADVVVLATISDTQRRKFNDISESVSLTVRVEKTFKNRAAADSANEQTSRPIPESFHLAFLVFPETFERHMRRPVGDGRYVIFLNRKVVVDANGEQGEALVLTEPRPFAFLPYSESALSEVEALAAAAAKADPEAKAEEGENQ